MLTHVYNFTTYICFKIIHLINISMFTEEDRTAISNEDEKEF